MKSVLTIIIFLFFIFNAEGQINIQQINSSEFEDFLSSQSFKVKSSDISSIVQLGNYNTAKLSQTKEGDIFSFSNSSNSFQQGNFNLVDITQIGSGNLLLSFQFGYQGTEIGGNQGNHFGYGLDKGNGNAYAYGHQGTDNTYEVAGDGNKLTVSQDGNNNGVMAVQQGTDNSATASQKGNNNYLMILQKGSNNTVSGYTQENTSENISFDTVIQLGENLSLNATEESKSKPNGNKFIQSGDRLSLQINNGFLNTLGGVEITQTGSDMKVVIDQSYFTFPMK